MPVALVTGAGRGIGAAVARRLSAARSWSPPTAATVVRALEPDVAFVHALRAWPSGEAVIGAPSGDAVPAVGAAGRTVVVAEELAEGVVEGAAIPGVLVDAVVECAGAVAPDGVAGRYPRDVAAYLAYPG